MNMFITLFICTFCSSVGLAQDVKKMNINDLTKFYDKVTKNYPKTDVRVVYQKEIRDHANNDTLLYTQLCEVWTSGKDYFSYNEDGIAIQKGDYLYQIDTASKELIVMNSDPLSVPSDMTEQFKNFDSTLALIYYFKDKNGHKITFDYKTNSMGLRSFITKYSGDYKLREVEMQMDAVEDYADSYYQKKNKAIKYVFKYNESKTFTQNEFEAKTSIVGITVNNRKIELSGVYANYKVRNLLKINN